MGTIVRLRGLPYTCSKDDLCDGFFKGFNVIDLRLVERRGKNDTLCRDRGLDVRHQCQSECDYMSFCFGYGLRSGKCTGEAYVEFYDPEEARRAIEAKHNGYFSGRYVEVRNCHSCWKFENLRPERKRETQKRMGVNSTSPSPMCFNAVLSQQGCVLVQYNS